MTLSDMKAYLRVDGNDDDALIQSLIAAAESYIKKTTGKTKAITGYDETGIPIAKDISESELWNLLVKLMVSHWYENRGPEVIGATVSKVSHTVDALINHISMCGDYL